MSVDLLKMAHQMAQGMARICTAVASSTATSRLQNSCLVMVGSQQVDIYAFAITSVGLLTKGTLPWPMADDSAVRCFFLHEKMRLEPPSSVSGPCSSQRFSTYASIEAPRCGRHSPGSIRMCSGWARASGRTSRGPRSPPQKAELEMHARKSPEMHPIPFPLLPRDMSASFIEEESMPFADTSYRTAAG
ncbi:hypothetical protein C8Q79DRAFT_1010862 [Trametes meyenii]|nr:hypothetical protein C8Q79DRAFT_1010862 [Trametes meyenii]